MGGGAGEGDKMAAQVMAQLLQRRSGHRAIRQALADEGPQLLHRGQGGRLGHTHTAWRPGTHPDRRGSHTEAARKSP